MNATEWIGRLLGYENVQSIERVELTLAAPWAIRWPAAVVFGCAALAVLSVLFYFRGQPRVRGTMRTVLGVGRALLLCLLLLILAEPVLKLVLTSQPRPLLYLLFDGTDSMAIADDLSEEDFRPLAEAVGLDLSETVAQEDPAEDDAESNGAGSDDSETDTDENAAAGDAADSSPQDRPQRPTRVALVQSLLKNQDQDLLERLLDKFRVRAFLIDRPDGVRSLPLSEEETATPDAEYLASQLTATGEVTALGRALEDLAVRHSTEHLAGVVIFSDFDQNSGPAPIGSQSAPVGKLGVPIHTVGVGAPAAADLALKLSTRPVMKKAERDSLLVTLKQNELDGREVMVRLSHRRLAGEGELPGGTAPELVDEKAVTLTEPLQTVEFEFTPDETGRFEFEVSVEPLEGEVVEQNNRDRREVSVRDDFLRLLYLAYEPTWEWRFVKEVFHRDKLVGMRGFRTFLRSSDPKVRRTNPLFEPTLSPQRSKFFANDVLFLDDMPHTALSSRFCEMVKEFVSEFGGGLVVIAGPRFGPGQLAETPLADLLPISAELGSRPRDQQEFRLQRTHAAQRYDFMRLGNSDAENLRGWNNLGRLPWYQPVSKVHPLATVLAEHPHDLCDDGKTRQPLIAIRPYGKGEVVYLGFNEMWRLRRKYGELYYRQFWGQLIYHLGLRHALGSQKRFVVRTDRQRYQPDDRVSVWVEAYDENFEPLEDDDLEDRKLTGEWVVPSSADEPNRVESIQLPFASSGVFETQFSVLEPGEHHIRVRDPVTRQYSEVIFQVTGVSVERQNAVRNLKLQQELALASAGRSWELTDAGNLPDQIELTPITERTVEVFPLWSTWLCFFVVVLLMLSEWLTRKWVNLP